METVKTEFATPKTKKQGWYLVDAKGVNLGRLSARLARILMGKHKACYTPHEDTGDFVVVINASSVSVTGKKMTDKVYYSHSGYPGGIKERVLQDVLAIHPERVLEHAIRGMLPKNRLGRAMFKKLKVYAGETHPHEAQGPVKIDPLKF